LTIEEIRAELAAEVISGSRYLDRRIDEVCGADLMSDVLAFTVPGGILLTGLSNVQSVITAHVAEVQAIVYVRGKKPDADALKLAEQKQIPLLCSPLSMFEACGRLFVKGLRSGSNLKEK
jgi:predicted transcriptional regulator